MAARRVARSQCVSRQPVVDNIAKSLLAGGVAGGVCVSLLAVMHNVGRQ